MKTFSLKEVKKEKLVIIGENVYDLKKFTNHPGGMDILKEFEGMDATDMFNMVCHSDRAKEMMKDFQVGKLKK